MEQAKCLITTLKLLFNEPTCNLQETTLVYYLLMSILRVHREQYFSWSVRFGINFLIALDKFQAEMCLDAGSRFFTK